MIGPTTTASSHLRTSTLFVAPCLLACTLLSACTTPTGISPPRNTDGLQSLGSTATNPSAALLNSQPIPISSMVPALMELAGAQVLEELALDRLLDAALVDANITLSPAQIALEEKLLLASIASEAQTSSDDASRMLDALRTRRGLGPTRYHSQLRRTAALRALVADEARPTQEQIDQEIAIATGARVRARLMLSPSQQTVAAARSEVLAVAATLDRIARFSVLAQRSSVDASASRGGLVESLALADPAVPSALRSSLQTLAVGDISPVIALDAGFALVLVEETLSPQPLSASDAQQRAQVKLERLAMDRRARQLLEASNLVPLENSLAWSWRSK